MTRDGFGPSEIGVGGGRPPSLACIIEGLARNRNVNLSSVFCKMMIEDERGTPSPAA